MPKTTILEHTLLRDKSNLTDAKKAFNKGFSQDDDDWNYNKVVGRLAFWAEDNKGAYKSPTDYGTGHIHSLGSDGFYSISAHGDDKKGYDARIIFKLKQQGGGPYLLWIYAIAMHKGSDIGGYQCFPKVVGGTSSFRWVHVSPDASGTRYLFATDTTRLVSA